MNTEGSEAEVRRTLQEARRHLRGARIAAAAVASAILLHLWWLLLPCAAEVGGLVAVAIMGYPLALGILAVAPLYHASLRRGLRQD